MGDFCNLRGEWWWPEDRQLWQGCTEGHTVKIYVGVKMETSRRQLDKMSGALERDSGLRKDNEREWH